MRGGAGTEHRAPGPVPLPGARGRGPRSPGVALSRSLEALKDEDIKKCPREAVSPGPEPPLGACPGLRELNAGSRGLDRGRELPWRHSGGFMQRKAES